MFHPFQRALTVEEATDLLTASKTPFEVVEKVQKQPTLPVEPRMDRGFGHDPELQND
jgi:hypothetical protein